MNFLYCAFQDMNKKVVNFFLKWYHFISDLIQNTTIEERVTILESQVIGIEEDITGLNIGLAEVDQNVDFLFDEQVIQDERLFSLEQTSLGILGELDSVEDELEGKVINTKISLLTWLLKIFCFMFKCNRFLSKNKYQIL